MCGFCGIAYSDFQRRPSESLVRTMNDQISHRGPDDFGVHISEGFGFGHRRLSILDLSSAGHQPMSNEAKNIWLTFNGEIYNFRAIRSELESKGYVFRSQTDSEVIIKGYEEWGINILDKLNGMFAFGLWDERIKSLFLARDRLGIKPLFYYLNDEKIVFGSEIKAILGDTSISRHLDRQAFHNYLSFNYMSAPLTGFQNIRQVMPGEYLKFSKGNVSIQAYWDLHYREPAKRSDQDYLEEFDSRLKNAVESQLVSDVPFGAFLSGGVDSSSIVALMKETMTQPVKTFSIGFKEESFNETSYAQQVSSHLKTEHYEEIVSPDLIKLLPKLVWHAEEPTADSSMLPVFCVAGLARKHVSMVLSGDGADEILAGYETYQAHYLAEIYRKIPSPVRSVLNKAVSKLPVSHAKVSFDYKAKAFVEGAARSREDAHFAWREIFSEQQKRDLYSAEFLNHFAPQPTVQIYRDYFNKSDARDFLNKMLYVDTRFYLPSDMLVKVDRMTMAHSLEARVPFLDHELVEFVASLPTHLKLKQFRKKKFILKQAMASRLPHSILHRKKAGFNVPVGRWIAHELKDYVCDTMSRSAIQKTGIFNSEKVESLLSDHFSRKKDNGYRIWGLLVFMTWWNMFKVEMPKEHVL